MKLFANLFNITSTKIGQYPGDTEGDSIIATGAGSAEKGETAQVYGMPGLISNPGSGVKGVRIRIGSLDIIIAALNYQVPLPSVPGETKLYSTDADGAEQATVTAKADGILEVNGNADFAVAFNDLKIEFEKLQTEWDTFATAYVPGSPTVTGLPPTASPSGSNIDNAKVSTVKMP